MHWSRYFISCTASYVKEPCFFKLALISALSLCWIFLCKAISYKVKAIVELVVSKPAMKNWTACATTFIPSEKPPQLVNIRYPVFVIWMLHTKFKGPPKSIFFLHFNHQINQIISFTVPTFSFLNCILKSITQETACVGVKNT